MISPLGSTTGEHNKMNSTKKSNFYLGGNIQMSAFGESDGKKIQIVE
jgi:hypothetical protein